MIVTRVSHHTTLDKQDIIKQRYKGTKVHQGTKIHQDISRQRYKSTYIKKSVTHTYTFIHTQDTRHRYTNNIKIRQIDLEVVGSTQA